MSKIQCFLMFNLPNYGRLLFFLSVNFKFYSDPIFPAFSLTVINSHVLIFQFSQ
jgi:hypothetical protein